MGFQHNPEEGDKDRIAAEQARDEAYAKADAYIDSDGPHPTVYLLTPNSTQAKAWCKGNVQVAEWQDADAGIAVEHRYIEDIAKGMLDAGFDVRMNGKAARLFKGEVCLVP
jgi:hypothetical protein